MDSPATLESTVNVDPYSLNGKNVLVTGGTRGLGRAISLRFARAGAQVVANYVQDVKAAASLIDDATREGLSIRTVRANITLAGGLDSLVQELQGSGQLTCVVHCAATGVHKPVDQLEPRHFDWTFALNVRAFLELVRRVLPIMPAGGAIVGISSEGAVRAVPQYALVGASKGALEALLRHMASELAPRGIRVNAISPGTLRTDVWNALPDSDRRLADATTRSPLGRLTSVDEVAAAAQFLCSDAASGIIGQTLVVDCGTGIVA
jgi:enoyl-[acyl-carrier protein] reductase III